MLLGVMVVVIELVVVVVMSVIPAVVTVVVMVMVALVGLMVFVDVICTRGRSNSHTSLWWSSCCWSWL